MPHTSNVSGASLVPNIRGFTDPLTKAFESRLDREATASESLLKRQAKANELLLEMEAEAIKQEAIQRQSDIIGQEGITPEEEQAALLRIGKLGGPEILNAFNKILERGDEAELAATQKITEQAARDAVFLQGIKDPLTRRQEIGNIVARQVAAGEDTTATVGLLDLTPEELDLAFQKQIIHAKDFNTLLDNALQPEGEIIPSSEITEGFVIKQNLDGTFTTTRVLDSATVADSGKASAVTKIFDNGSTVQALPNGKTVVKGPDGVPVEGDARIAVLKQARAEEIAFQLTQAGAKVAGSEAIKQSTKAFERIGEIKISISNIDKAIDLLNKGAKTGPVISKLPSIRASSVALDNVQKAMGLDVIGDTTFGALSKGELDLALSKALPTGLKPIALKEWLTAKKESQEKLSTYLEDVAVYLGAPGNTVAGWLEAQQAIAGNEGIGVSGQQPTSNQDRILFDISGVQQPTIKQQQTGGQTVTTETRATNPEFRSMSNEELNSL